jgi:hypothetical protein
MPPSCAPGWLSMALEELSFAAGTVAAAARNTCQQRMAHWSSIYGAAAARLQKNDRAVVCVAAEGSRPNMPAGAA